MKLFLVYLYCTVLVFSPAFVSSASEYSVAMVESISFLGERDGGEIIHFQLNGNMVPRVFELPGDNPRLVFDFIKTGYPARGKKVIRAGGKIVKRLRVGIHKEPVAKTRVVIDLASSKEFEIEKEFIPAKNILEVRIFPKTSGTKISANLPPTKDEAPPRLIEEVEEEKKSAATTAQGQKNKPDEDATPDQKMETVVRAEVDNAPVADKSVLTKEQSTTSSSKDTEIAGGGGNELPLLLNISYENTTNNKEMVLFKLSGFHPPVVFAIEEDEPRIVCDFLDVGLGNDVEQVLNSKGDYISRVRVAQHQNPEKVRVVLDLVASNDYDMKQVFFKDGNLFVVIISVL